MPDIKAQRFTELTVALDRISEARTNLKTTVKKFYPVDAPISWEWNERVQDGVVVDHDFFGGRIKVRNDRTGTERWIHVERIVGDGDA